MESSPAFWKKCSSCKKALPFRSRHYTCSVSTCNTKKLGLVFCSVGCWDAHLGFARHRDADAIELYAPSEEDYVKSLTLQNEVKMSNTNNDHMDTTAETALDHGTTNAHSDSHDILIVTSKVKRYVKEQGGLNTSQDAIDALSDAIARICREGIERAKADGRKTFMARDIS